MQKVQVWSLVGELKSQMPLGQENQDIKQKQCCNTVNKNIKDSPQRTGTTQRDGVGREEGSGWGAYVYLWWICFDVWQN